MEHRIKHLAHKHLAAMQRIRRDLHQHPELAHQEFRTQQIIRKTLSDLNIDHHVSALTGVVGIIHGKHPGKAVLLRADMDALPILEEADVEYRSLIDGVMHACGHDGHTAGLLGAAMILSELKDDIHGTIKLMFQPAEETDGGALPMIQEGILENPSVDAAFGLHLGGHLPLGSVQVCDGAMYGAPDEFEIEIIGKGGHAASPEQTVDPISLAVQFITNAQFILTRKLNPIKPAVISFTKIHAGAGLNVIPGSCTLGGTIRTLYPDTRQQVSAELYALLESMTALNQASFTFNYTPSYPPLINDSAMTALAKRAFVRHFGESAVSEAEFPTLGAEDFAYLALEVPSSYYNVGIWSEGKAEPIHHHPEFAWDDSVLEICSQSLAVVALNFLGNYLA